MKDYRSLEHKIRDMYVEAAVARGTALRQKVVNVGRPDTAEDPTDTKSTLAKQGKIEKKIIEGKVPDNWEENSKSKRVATAKKLADDAMDHDSTDKIVPHVPKITEAFKTDTPAKQDGDMDDMDAKKLTGGKTDVDLHPKTDDRVEDQSEEDKVSKKATKKVNKEIGQTGAKGVKEMHNPTKNFGLSDSLIEATRKVMTPVVEADQIDEKLVGGQKKLDKNHNGKLDGQDFKMLRKEEAVAEGNADNKEKKNAAVAAVGAKNKDGHYLNKMNPAVADKIRGREKMSGVDRKHYGEEVVSEGPTSPVVKKEKFDTADMVAKFKAKGGTVTKGKTAAAYGAKVPKRTKAMKEDVELSAEEMARIEAIIAEINL
jgi:hypothetical protein